MTETVRRTGPQELLQIAAVATQYYRDGRSKVEIADDLGMSRFRVARLLTAARDLGIVKIDITVPDAINTDLSTRLADAFRLRQAIVVDTPDEPITALRADLGRVAANLLTEIVAEDDVVGIAWGRTVNAMTSALTRINRCSIVQMTGALSGSEVNHNAIELVRRISQVSGGAAYPIYAPFLLDDPTVAQALRSQAEVAEALSWYERVTTAVVPVGSWDPPQSQLYDLLTVEERHQLLDAGVRADTSTVMLTGDSDILIAPICQRMIGITGEQLRRIPEVVAVAGGTEKTEAISVVLRAGFVTTLITNSSVAQQLLARAPSSN